jgi:predicted Zn-dependent peptidase
MSPAKPRSRVLERGPGDAVISATTLPGGLRVVTETVSGSRSASVGVWVAVGSADEKPQLAGASHYLEHLLFKGTRRRDAATIAGLIDAVGGELNAFTAHEYTCYYAHVLAEDAAAAVDVVCDVVLSARIASRDVETERSVILDEIAMRDDDPADALAEAFAHRMFAGHPVGDPVSGTTRSVRALSRSQIHGYYRRRYDPSMMVVAIAGGVTHRDAVRWVREAFADRLVGDRKPAPPRVGPGFTARRPSVGVLTRDTEQAQLTVGVPALPRHHPQRYALAVLSAVLGGGMSSRLFQRIREQHGLAYTCYSSTSAYADTGSWSLYTACSPANLGQVADLIGRELAAVARDGVTADELALAQGQLCGATVLGLEDTESRMNRIGRRSLTTRRYVSLDDELTAMRHVTADEVTTIARQLLSRPLTAAVAGPYARMRELPDTVRTLARTPVWTR